MPRYDIPWEDNYIGDWGGEASRELRIRKVGPRRYLATLLINGQPIKRPWMNGEPTIDMPATYSFNALDGSDFAIDLWSEEQFAINLSYEPAYHFGNDSLCETLIMTFIRDSELDFLDQYYSLLGGLGNLIRVKSNEA